MKRILFVCMGNICRSPAAEGVFRRLVAERGLADRIEIDSAGTIGYHAGDPPDARMTAAAARRGISLDGQSARHFQRADLDAFDMVLAMDRANLRDIRALDESGRHARKIKLFLDFHPSAKGTDVPDPYYGGPDGFEKVLDLIQEAAEPLLGELLKEES